MYLDYDFYTDTFMGSIDEEEFNKYVIIAQSYVDSYTRHLLNFYELSEEDKQLVRFCMCELIDNYGVSITRSGIASESIGDMSVSYSASTMEGLRDSMIGILDRWLGDTGIQSGWI